MSQPALFSCTCGQTQWAFALSKPARVKCYCTSCQTFANHLGGDILDADSGSDICQAAPHEITFTKGADNLALTRLSPKGLFRWHTSCCNSPVANTLKIPGIAFVGLYLSQHTGDRDAAFGPIACYNATKEATSESAPKSDRGIGNMIRSIIGRALKNRLNGRYKETPFFTFPDRAPVATPTILTKEQRDAATPS